MKDLSIVFIVLTEMKIVLVLAEWGHVGVLPGKESTAKSLQYVLKVNERFAFLIISSYTISKLNGAYIITLTWSLNFVVNMAWT